MGSRLSSTQEQPKTLMETTVCDVSFATVSFQSVSKNLRFNLSKVQTEHFQKGSTFEIAFESLRVQQRHKVCPVFTRIIYIILQLHSFYTTRYLYLTKSVGLPVVASLSFRKSTRAKIQITLFSVKKNV